MAHRLRITESSNEITKEIDVQSPLEIFHSLQRCDEEMFNGFEEYPGLKHDLFNASMEKLIATLESALVLGEGALIICIGSGTSGRLAHFISRAFNNLLRELEKPAIFRYLIAGGDYALRKAREGAEDDAELAARDFKAIVQSCPGELKKIVLLGVTCGLSATYVGAQIDQCLEE